MTSMESVSFDAHDIAIADIDGDTRLDIIASFQSGDVIVYEQNTADVFTRNFAATVTGARGLDVGDVNGDGSLDIAVAGSTGVYWLENDGAGSPTFTVQTALTLSDIADVKIAQFNAGTDADIAYYRDYFFGSHIGWLESDGAPTPGFTQQVISTLTNFNTYSANLVAADIDGSGSVDLVLGRTNADLASIYSNDGTGTFTQGTQSLTPDGPEWVEAADLDGDGDLELLYAQSGDSTFSVQINRGAGVYTTINANEDTAITGLQVQIDDIDAGSSDLSVTLTVTHGIVTIPTGAVAFSGGINSGNSVTFTGTVTEINTALNSFSFTPATDYFGEASIAIAVDDQGNSGSGGAQIANETLILHVQSVNDAPQLVGPSIVTNGDFQTGDLSGWSANGNVDNDGTQARFGQIGGANGTLSQTLTTEIGRTYVLSFDYRDGSATNSQSLDIDVVGSGELVNASIDSGIAENTARTYQYTFVADSTSTTITFSDTSADHSGVRGYLDNVSVATDATPNPDLAYTENDGPVVIDATIDIEDIDDTHIGSATVQITGNYVNGEDILGFVDQSGITGSWNSTTGELTLTGSATIVDYETALRSVTFENTSENPTTTTRTVSFTVNDGDVDSNTQSRDIVVTSVNDDPTNAGTLPTDITVTEDVASSLDLSSIDLSDVDAGAGSLTLTLSTSGGGNLSGLAGTGITVGGSLSSTLTLQGSLTDLNNYLNDTTRIFYLHQTPNTSGMNADTITVVVNDNGNTGTGGGTDQTLGTISVDITPVNDPASVATNTGITVTEGGSVTITNAELNEGDPDDDGANIIYRVRTDINAGTLFLNGAALEQGDTFTQADIDAGLISYTHAGGQDTTESLRLAINDVGDAGETQFVVNVTVIPANDAPVAADDPVGSFDPTADTDTLGFWRLGESSGTTAVDAAGGNDGTYNNVTLGSTGAVSGDTAADFSGTNSYVNLGNLDVAGSGLTMAAWINADTFGTGDGRIIAKSDGTANADHTFMLSVMDVGADVFLRLRVSAGNHTEVLVASDYPLNTSQWHHVAATYDQTTGEMAIYLDGQLVDFGQHSVGGAVDQDPTQDVWIGGNPAGSNFFDGRIDEALLMGRALSAGEIVALADQAPPDYSVGENGTLSVNVANGVLQNDSDVEGDALTVIEVNGVSPSVGNQISLGSGALLTLNADGSFAYDPNGQFDSLGVGQSTTDTFTYTVSDGNGGTDTATVNVLINGNNDAPVATNIEGTALTYTENDGAVALTSTITFTDVDDTNIESAVVQITGGYNSGEDVLSFTNQNGISGVYDSGAGTWTLTGSATLAQYEAAIRSITYTNTSENPNNTTRTVSFTVNDGNANSNTLTRDILIGAVNDGPLIANLGGDTLNYSEGDGAVIIDQSTNAAVTDVDSANLDTGSLTVSFAAGSDSAEDVLAIVNQGTGAGQIGVSSTNVTYQGTTIGTFTGGSAGADLVITLNANADATATSALIQAISYENTDSDNPTTGARTVRYVLTDGDGGTSANYDTTVSFTAVNDAPVVTGPGSAYSFTEQGSLIIHGTGFGVTDVDDNGGMMTGTFTVGEGRILIDAGDSGVTLFSGAFNTSGNSTDTVTFTGTKSQINALLSGSSTGTIFYYHDQTTSSDVPSASTTITLTVNDQGNTGSDPGNTADGSSEEHFASQAINITSVNDSPEFLGLNLVTNGTFDTDLSGWTTTGTVTGGAGRATFGSGGNAGPHTLSQTIATTIGDVYVLEFDYRDGHASLNQQLQVTVDGSSNLLTSEQTLTDTDGSTFVRYRFEFTADSTSSTLTFTDTSDDAGSLSARTNGVDSAIDNVTLYQTSGQLGTASFTEDGSAVVLDSNVTLFDAEIDAVLDDFDGTTLTLARNGGANSDDVFSENGLLGALTEGGSLVYNSVTVGAVTTNSGGTLVLTFHATADQTTVNNVMQAIAYGNASDTPPSIVQIDWTFNDNNDSSQGSGGTADANGYTIVNITAANDAPVIQDGRSSYNVNEGVRNALFNGRTVTDPDSGDFDGGTLTFSFVGGGVVDNTDTIALVGFNGVSTSGSNVLVSGVTVGSFTGGSSGNPLVITFNNNATVVEVEAVYGAASFGNITNDPVAGERFVEAVLTDGDGGTSNTGYASIIVNPVNDAPTNAVPGAQSVNEDDTLVFSTGNGNAITVSDSDAGTDALRVQLDVDAGGLLTLSQTTGLTFSAGDGSSDANMIFTGTAADINAALNGMSFVTTANFNGSVNLTVTTNDQGNNGSDPGNTGDGSSEEDTDIVAITVNAVNDDPTTSHGGAYTINEGDSLGLDASGSADIDGDTLTYRWDLNNDSIYDITTTSATITPAWSALTSYGIDDDGVYTIGLQVDDGNGGLVTSSTTVTVNNMAPTLTATGAATVGGGATYTLTLTDMDPGNDTISQWIVNWGDGTITTHAGDPSSVTHVYSNDLAGLTFDITVSAIDEDGQYFEATVLVPAYGGDYVNEYDGANGTFVGSFAPSSDGILGHASIVVMPNGNYLVSGVDSGNIVEYQPDGTLVGDFVAASDPNLNNPGGLAYGPDGNLYVADYGGGKIVRFDGTTGAYIDDFVASGLTSPLGLQFGPDGNLYVANRGSAGVLRYDGSTGALDSGFVVSSISGAEDLTFGPDGNIYVGSTSGVIRVDATTGATSTFIATGTGGLGLAAGVDFGPDGNLYVTDQNNSAVRIYDGTTGAYLGDYATGISGPAYLEFTADHRVTITNSNQSPTIATNNGGTVLEGSSGSVITTAMLNEGDPDDDGAELTYTITSNVTNGTLRLNGTAIGLNDTFTQADLDAGLVTYDHNDSETTSDAFSFSLADGGENGSTPVTGTFNLTVTSVNDAPINTMPGSLSTDMDTPLILSGANALQVSDVDAGTNSIQITLSATAGTLTLASTSGLTFSAGDGTNDTNMVLTGTVTNINAALDGLTFTPTTSYTGAATINLLTEDLGNTGGGNLSDNDQLTIQVGGVTFQQGVNGYTGTDDTYVRSGLSSSTSYGNDTFVEVDEPTHEGLLRFDNIFGGGAGQIAYGSTITNASLSIYVTGTDALDAVEVHRMLSTWTEASTWDSLSSGISADGVEASTASLFTIDAGQAGWVTVTGITSTVQAWSDGAANEGFVFLGDQADNWTFHSSEYGTVSLRPYLTISYDLPQAPDVDLDADNSSGATGSDFAAGFIENGGPVLIADTDATITDADSTHFASMTVTITNLLDGTDESLAANTSGTSIAASYDSATGVLTLSGTDTVANYQQVLRTVRYDNTNENPDTTARVIDVQVADAFSTSNVASATLSITAVNDAPVVSGPGSAYNVNEQSNLNLHGTGFSVTDVDAGSGAMTATFTVGEGTVSLFAGDSGVAITANNASTVTFTGTLAQIDALLAGTSTGTIVYTNGSDTPSASTTITLTVNDGGNTGSDPGLTGDGVSEEDSASQTINITAINDEEVLATNAGATVAEGSTGNTLTTAMLHTTDVDNTDAQLVYTVDAVTSNGTLRLNGTALGLNDTFTQADIDAGNVTYDHDGSQTSADSFDFTVDDGAGTTTSNTFNFTVTNVNDAPVNTVPGAQTVNEDTSAAISGISVADADDNLSTVRLSVANGSLNVTLSGTASISAGANGSADLTLSGSLADINATLASLTYQGNLNFNGSDTLTVLSTDSNAASDSDTVAITVGAVNDTPSVTGPGSAYTVTEQTNLDIHGTGFSVNDVDAASGTTTATFTVGEGTIALAAGDSGVSITANNASTVTFTGTLAQIDALLTGSSTGTIVYTNGSDTPSASTTITLTVNDGGNTGTDPGLTGDGVSEEDSASQTINITAINDEEVLATNAGATVAEGSTGNTLTTAMLHTTDVDNTDAQLVYTVDAVNSNGTLRLNGTALGLNDTFTQADIDAGNVTYDHDGSQTSADSFDFTVDDGAGTTTSSTFNFTVTNVNDAPVNTVPGAQSVNEDTSLAISGISVADADDNLSTVRLSVANGSLNVALSGTASISAGANGSADLTLSGSLADINATLASLMYQGNLNFNGSDTLTVLSTDSNAAADSGTVAITVNAVNDAPLVGTNTGATVSEGGSVTITAAMLNEADVDDSGTGLTYTVTSAPTNGQLELTTNPGVAITSLTQDDIDNNRVVFVHDGTQASVDSFDFSLADGGEDAATPATGTFNFTVTNVNDAPINTVPGAQAVDEDTSLAITGISVADDDDNLSAVQLTVTNGTLNVTLSGAATVSAGANGSADLTLSGSLADVNTTLASLTYQGNLNFNGSDTLTIVSTDTDGATDSATVAIAVNPVNDAPVNVVPGTQFVAEETTTAITGISIGDVDTGGSNLTVRLQVSHGTLDISLSGSVFIAAGANGSRDLTLQGSATDINTTLSSLTYTGNVDVVGVAADAITVITNDLGNTGAGGPLTDTSFIQIDITPVNDTPVVSGPSLSYTVTEQSNLNLEGTGFTVADVDAGSGPITATIAVGEGTITVAEGNSGVAINSGNGSAAVTLTGTLTEIDNLLTGVSTGTITYFNASDTPSASTTLTLTVNDNGNTGADPGLTADAFSEEDSATQTISIAAVDDAPIISNVVDQAIDEDTSTGPLAFTVADPEGSTLTVSASSSDTTLIPNTNIFLADLGGGNWTIEVVPIANASGGPVSIEIAVDDGNSVATTQFAVVVTPVNDAPVVTGGPFTVFENASNGTFIGSMNVTDLDISDSHTFTITGGSGATIFAIDNLGQITVSDASQLDFETSSSFTIEVTATDSGPGNFSANRLVTIQVIDQNEIPIAVTDTYTTNEGDTLTVNSAGVTTNDLDPEGETLTVSLVSGPTHGTLTLNADGTFEYTHDGSETTSDSFLYAVTDSVGNTSTATVVLNIVPVNDAPDGTGDEFTLVGDELRISATNGVLANDWDIEGGQISSVLVGAPTNGSLSMLSDGSFVYAPDPGFIGTDSFTYVVSDGQTTSSPITVLIEVLGGVDPGTNGPTGGIPENTQPDVPTDDRDPAQNDSNTPIQGLDIVPPVELRSSPDRMPVTIEANDDRTTSGSFEAAESLLESGEVGNQATYSRYFAMAKRMDLSVQRLASNPFSPFVTVGVTKHLLTVLPATDAVEDVALDFQQLAVGTTAVISSALTVGYVVWLIRGGTIIASVLSTMPSWISFDPLPILDSFREEDGDEGASLANLVEVGENE